MHRIEISPGVLDDDQLHGAAQDAVRNYARPDRLSENPLATGFGTAERAATVRALVDRALGRAFGTCRVDAELQEVLTAGYLVADAMHERIAFELHLSRSTYFRRLAAGLDRLARQIAEDARLDVVHAAPPRFTRRPALHAA